MLFLNIPRLGKVFIPYRQSQIMDGGQGDLNRIESLFLIGNLKLPALAEHRIAGMKSLFLIGNLK